MSSYQLTFDFDQTFETLEDAFDHAINTCGWSKNSLAGEMGYSPSGFSKRLNQFPQENDPRFTLKDLEKFVQVTGNTLPVRYLAKKFLTKKEQEEKELLANLVENLPRLKLLVELLENKKRR
jgi:hypothetical protein